MITHEIKKIIEAAIPGSVVHILDPMNDGQHLQAIVISSEFDGIPLIKQHKMVMGPLKEAFEESVHALGLKTFAPDKWEAAKDQYNL